MLVEGGHGDDRARPYGAVYRALGALSIVVLFGIVGLIWSLWRHRTQRRPPTRSHRVRVALVTTALVVIALGSVWRFIPVVGSAPACSPPSGAQAATRAAPVNVSLVSEQVATWPETGIGLMYSQFRRAHVCLSRSADYLVAVHADNIAGTRAMNMGDIVLTPGFQISKEELRTLASHEAQHRTQWAIATAIAGPFAFPVAYAIEDFFFPGSRNQFERQAGLESGGYTHVGVGPVLGPTQIAALSVLAVAAAATLVCARHRRTVTKLRVRGDKPKARGSGMTRRTS